MDLQDFQRRGRQLRAHRLILGVRQVDLASRSRVPPRRISLFEHALLELSQDEEGRLHVALAELAQSATAELALMASPPRFQRVPHA